jgi:hypothetical protein
MALPTLAKSYNFNLNGALSSSYPTFWYQFKEALKGFSPGWTVAGSCKYTASGGMDAVDRWNSPTDVVYSGGSTQGSWVVLANAALGGLQLLVHPENNNYGSPSNVTMAVSPGGLYTGGDAYNLPSASDAISLLYDVPFLVDGSTNPSARIHAMMSTDGEKTRIITTGLGASRNLFMFEKAVDPVPGWTNPWVAVAIAYTAINQGMVYGNLANATSYTRGKAGSTVMPLYWTAEGWKFDATGSAAGQRMTWQNDLDSNGWPIAPIGLACETIGVRGRHGRLTDVWWGSTAIADGDHYPDTLPRQFVHVGDLVLPWNGAAGAIALT